MPEWNGDERRKEGRPYSNESHDMLIRIDQNLSNFMKRFDEHVIDDNKHFDRLYSIVGKNRWYIAMGLGGVLAFEIAIKFIK